MANVSLGDSMTHGPKSFADYLTAKRAAATVAASPSLSNAEVLAYVKDEYIKMAGSVVEYQYLGDDGSGDPVYKLGSIILLQNIKTQLDALVTAGSLTAVPGTNLGYSPNPHLR